MTRNTITGSRLLFSGTPEGHSALSRGTRSFQKKQSILVVDDDANLRMLLEYVLRKEYHVHTREDGLSAMAWLAAGNIPDLIIADVDMPRLNGYDLLRQLNASGYFRNIPVVMLSGYDDDTMKDNCLSEGAIDYLLKPFRPESMMARLHHLLHGAPVVGAHPATE